jgi:hypothetical protein
VTQEELDRVEAQRRGFQAENERLKAELAARAPAAPAPAAAAVPAPAPAAGPDLGEFRKSLLSEVVTATRLTHAAERLKAEYPHALVADPTAFDRAAEFGSVESFEAYVKSAHDRVAALLPAPAGGEATPPNPAAAAAVTPPAGSPGGQAGDPTPEQLAAMSIPEMNELERTSPGVIDRVLRSAT